MRMLFAILLTFGLSMSAAPVWAHGGGMGGGMMGPGQAGGMTGPYQNGGMMGPGQNGRRIGPDQNNRMVGPDQDSGMMAPGQDNRTMGPGRNGDAYGTPSDQRGGGRDMDPTRQARMQREFEHDSGRLQRDLDTTRKELNRELQRKNPDEQKVRHLRGELSDMRNRMDFLQEQYRRQMQSQDRPDNE